MPADILIYALVAAGLVFWLRSILGTRHGDERQRPNPFTQKPAEAAQDTSPGKTQDVAPGTEPAFPIGVIPIGAHAPQGQDPLALPTSLRAAIAGESVRAGLRDIVQADRSFTLSHFVSGAQDAFVMIVEAFAAGDRDLLKSLLSPELFKAFDAAITEREKAGQTMMTEIHAIRKTDIVEARMLERRAVITVCFVADETVVVRNAAGEILSGHPDRITETIDIWTFGRDTRSKDPTWLLLATREEAGDTGNQS